MNNIQTYNDFLHEGFDPNVVNCTSCGWTWKLQEGGDDVFICHKCGHDNTPILGEDEDLLKDLSTIGYDTSIGFMFLGTSGGRPVAFLVKARTEIRCMELLAAFIDSPKSTIASVSYNQQKHKVLPEVKEMQMREFVDLTVFLFEQGYISDSGYYGPFKGKDITEEFISIADEYVINAKDFVDLAYKHFLDADEAFNTFGHPLLTKYTPKDLGI
jgi:hypothetical protein